MMPECMRTLIFFDLPVETAKERRAYTVFRKWLLKNGYTMLQYSVYAKIANTRDAAMLHLKQLRLNAPKSGSVRAMLVTEKQYARMEIIIGGRNAQEKRITPDPLLIV